MGIQEEADRFINFVAVYLLQPVKETMLKLSSEIIQDYIVLFESTSSLAPYFVPYRFKDSIRYMNIWHRPVADIAGQTLQIQFTKDPDSTFLKLKENEAYPNNTYEIIAEHLDAYLEKLNFVLSDHERMMNAFKYRLDSMIEETRRQYRTQLQEAVIDQSFVR